MFIYTLSDIIGLIMIGIIVLAFAVVIAIDWIGRLKNRKNLK